MSCVHVANLAPRFRAAGRRLTFCHVDAASRDRIAMSLSFLSKKTWHTTNLKNVEQVWLAEKKQEEEQKKLEMWKKAREEERQKAELRELQQEVRELAARCRAARACARVKRGARVGWKRAEGS